MSTTKVFSGRRKYSINLISNPNVSSQTFNVSSFIQGSINLHKRYRMIIRAFSGSANQTGDHAVLIHLPFFRQDRNFTVYSNPTLFKEDDIALALQTSYNGDGLTYEDLQGTEGFHGYITDSTNWTVYLTTFDNQTAYNMQNNTRFFLRLEFEEIDE